MKNLNKDKKNKGASLVAAMAIMFLVAALSVVMASMLGVASRGSLDYLRSSQSFGLAQAGLNWYMEQLAGIADWDTTTDQTGISLNPGTFDLVLSNKAQPQTDSTTATRMDIAVTGKVTGTAEVIIQRKMSQGVWKLPSASKFALFWGLRTGSTLTLSSTTINGDYWSIGSSIFTGSTMNGTAYRPTAETITGPASTAITFPYFSNFSGSTSTNSMPAITPTYYTNLITTYNGMITGSGTVNLNADLVLTPSTPVNCQTFNTNTIANSNVTISGHGYIIASQNITLNGSGTNNRTLTISPSGGNIVFLAGRNLTINSGSGGTHPVTINSGPSSQVRMYACSASSTAQLLQINNANTTIDGALLLANRRIVVQNGANIINSTLFVNDAGSTTNNLLRVTGSGTIVGTVAGPCNLISMGRENAGGSNPTALTVDNNASATGLLYQFDTNNSGLTRINTATIIGTVIANKFQGNAVTSATITYNPSAIPDPPLEGFNGFATKKPDTWSGN